jgi:hypothetical protein
MNANDVYQTVRDVIALARENRLDLRNDNRAIIQTEEDIARAVTILRSSYAFKDRVPGWYQFRDRVVKTWPKDARNMKREMHGLLTAKRGEW